MDWQTTTLSELGEVGRCRKAGSAVLHWPDPFTDFVTVVRLLQASGLRQTLIVVIVRRL